jgi:hypothetical protein
MHRLPVLGLLVCSLACGDDDNGNGPTFISVNGSWNVSITNMTGSGAQCSTSSPIQINLLQSTTTFSGSYGGGGVLTCTSPVGSFSAATGSGSVLNGEISGSQISFDLGSADFHHEGTVSGSSMTGTATWTFQSGSAGALGVLTGTWTATKQ